MRELHVSTTWICDGICLYVFNYDETYVSASSININSECFALIGGFYANMGPMMLEGSKLAPTGIMLMFAILYFGIMIDSGLFDPVISKILKFVKEIL